MGPLGPRICLRCGPWQLSLVDSGELVWDLVRSRDL